MDTKSNAPTLDLVTRCQSELARHGIRVKPGPARGSITVTAMEAEKILSLLRIHSPVDATKTNLDRLMTEIGFKGKLASKEFIALIDATKKAIADLRGAPPRLQRVNAEHLRHYIGLLRGARPLRRSAFLINTRSGVLALAEVTLMDLEDQ